MRLLAAWFKQLPLWHFVWMTVVLSVSLAMLMSRLIHGRVMWDYPFTASLISLVCASLVISIIQHAHKSQKEVLQQSLDFSLKLLNEFPSPIWRSGLDAKCDYFNTSWLNFTGRTIEQERGDGWAEGVHPDDLDRCLRTYLTAFQARTPFEMEYRLRRYDGTYRWIVDIGRPYYDYAGRFAGYIGSCYDISEHRLAEEAIRKSEASLAEAQRIARLGNWDWNIPANELRWSDEIYRVFGLIPQEFGRHMKPSSIPFTRTIENL